MFPFQWMQSPIHCAGELGNLMVLADQDSEGVVHITVVIFNDTAKSAKSTTSFMMVMNVRDRSRNKFTYAQVGILFDQGES